MLSLDSLFCSVLPALLISNAYPIHWNSFHEFVTWWEALEAAGLRPFYIEPCVIPQIVILMTELPPDVYFR